MYSALGSQFEEGLLKVVSNFVSQESIEHADYSKLMLDCVKLKLSDGPPSFPDYHTSETYSTITSISSSELDTWRTAYKLDLYYCVF